MLGRSLRVELASEGASAGVLYPGWVATPIADAVVAGIEARAARIIEPKRWIPLSTMRGAVNIAADRHLERDQETRRLIKRVDGEERQRLAGRNVPSATAKKSASADGEAG